MATIEKLIVKQMALSLNHQNSGDDKVPYLSIAYIAEDSGGALTEEQIDGYFGKYTYRSWFNINGDTKTPMDWTKRFELNDTEGFKDVPVTMYLRGARKELELEFDGCRLYWDRLRLIGGMILPDFHIHVIEHTDNDMIQIRKAEYSEVKLSLGEGVLIERKARKQRQLPFDADPNADKDDEQHPDPDATNGPPLTGAHLAQPDETLIWWVHGPSGENSCGKRCDMPTQHCVEIDPPAGCKSEAEQEALEHGKAAAAGTMPDVELPALQGNEEFAEGVAKAIGAHKKRGSAIDGRSERVKHRDAKRDGAH